MPVSDLDLLLDAAAGAGRIAMRYWRQSPQVWEKDAGAGPVTEADLAVNDWLSGHLRAARPGYGWLSEETPDNPDRLTAQHCFIIDPIDGTRAFIDGDPGFSHSLAIARDGHVTAAVVHLPARGLTYAAAADGPATLNGRPLRVSGTGLPDAVVLTGKPTLSPVLWQGGAAPGFRRSFRPSLAWRICLVAEGRFDVAMSLRPAWEWDIAAGSLIAQRAGAVVSDRHGAALRFNSETGLADGLIVANPALHEQISGRLLRDPAV
ncbi:MAG: 3'(2'),5'-bisphosphate nucleotidase CysQ [Paracoccus sp. (in: a-proteobacteria)]|nr:3'(2'),5'-bisphosphate nucleotidase CysQ [Paracoccus sp. (in: a-proteobacteria)]